MKNKSKIKSERFIKSVRIFATIFLIISIVLPLGLSLWYIYKGEQPLVILLVLLPRLLLGSVFGLILFFALKATSIVLEHLFYIRKYLESNKLQNV